jgi:hypothetical protein
MRWNFCFNQHVLSIEIDHWHEHVGHNPCVLNASWPLATLWHYLYKYDKQVGLALHIYTSGRLNTILDYILSIRNIIYFFFLSCSYSEQLNGC